MITDIAQQTIRIQFIAWGGKVYVINHLVDRISNDFFFWATICANMKYTCYLAHKVKEVPAQLFYNKNLLQLKRNFLVCRILRKTGAIMP